MTRRASGLKAAILVALLLLSFGGSLLVGRYPAPGFMGPRAIISDPLAARLLLSVRLPRVLTAILLGVSLSAAGTVFQMVFSNPLVEPGFLGVSQGAAFGAALSIVAVSASPAVVQAGALVFGLAGLALSYLLARSLRFGGWILRLLLSGIAVSAVFSAGIGVLKMAADPMGQLPEITFWLLGGLWGSTWRSLLFILAPACAGLAGMLLMRWRLNALSLDDRVAHSLGIRVEGERLFLLFCATLATASVVSVSGLVGWIGLMVPHAARRLFGADGSKSLPASMALGAVVVLLCDDLARSALPAEIPLGILTSVLGAGMLMVFMSTRPRAPSPSPPVPGSPPAPGSPPTPPRAPSPPRRTPA